MTLALAGLLARPSAQRCTRSLRYVIKGTFRLGLEYTRMHTWKRSLQLCCLLSSPLQCGVGPRGQTLRSDFSLFTEFALDGTRPLESYEACIRHLVCGGY